MTTSRTSSPEVTATGEPTVDGSAPQKNATLPPGDGRAAANTKRRRFRLLLIVAAVIVAGVAAAWWANDSVRPHLYSGTVLQNSAQAPPLEALEFSGGGSVDLAAFADDVVLVYFGYTNCPDVCPTTLSTVAKARESMGSGASDRTHLLMISVDPERDDPAALQDYVEFFDPAFRGVGGSVAAIDEAASLYGVFYELGEGDATTGYTVDHTGSLMGIGPDGSLRIVWPPGVSAADLSNDIEELLS